jgi:hypothetical protein
MIKQFQDGREDRVVSDRSDHLTISRPNPNVEKVIKMVINKR